MSARTGPVRKHTTVLLTERERKRLRGILYGLERGFTISDPDDLRLVRALYARLAPTALPPPARESGNPRRPC